MDAGESEETEIVFDYGFDTEEKEKCAPMIVCRETRYGSYAASTLANKGVNAYNAAFVAAWIKGLGIKKSVARSDNEPALLKLLDNVSEQLPRVEWVPKTSPEGDAAGRYHIGQDGRALEQRRTGRQWKRPAV